MGGSINESFAEQLFKSIEDSTFFINHRGEQIIKTTIDAICELAKASFLVEIDKMNQ